MNRTHIEGQEPTGPLQRRITRILAVTVVALLGAYGSVVVGAHHATGSTSTSSGDQHTVGSMGAAAPLADRNTGAAIRSAVIAAPMVNRANGEESSVVGQGAPLADHTTGEVIRSVSQAAPMADRNTGAAI